MSAFGETTVQDPQGNVQAGIPVDLIDPVTNLRITDTVFLDDARTITATLPLTSDASGHARWYLTTGKLVIARATINGIAYDEYVPTVDPTAAGGGGGTLTAHTHAEGDVTNLVVDLNNKSSVGHTHLEGDVVNLGTDLTGKAAAVHTHAEADVTNLTTDLGGKAPTVHSHTVPVTLARFRWSNPTGTDIQIVGSSDGTQTISEVRGAFVGATGAGAVINWRLRGTDLVLTSPGLTTTAAPSFAFSTTIASTSLANRDQVEAMLQSITGAPSVVIIELLGTRSAT